MLLKRRTIIIRSLIILISIISFSSTVFGQESAQGTPEGRALELRNLLASVEGVAEEPHRVFQTEEGYLRFIMAPHGTHFGMVEDGGKKPEETSRSFLEKWHSLFVSESSAVGFDDIRITTSDSRSYVRYQQKYAVLEVFGAQMIIQVNKAGGIEAVISDIMRDTTELDTGKVSLKPSIDSFTAKEKAVQFLAAQHQQELEFEASLPTLKIFSPAVVGNTGIVALVWQTEVGNVGERFVKELLLVDAHTGEITFHYSLIYTAKHREIYDYEGRTYNPILVRQEGPNLYGVDDVDRAYDYLGDTYDFYYSHHGRDSFDNNGTDLIAEVRYGVWDAWWLDTDRMRIGEGCVTDDTVGHEFTHGVTECESQLGGTNEPGAIRESLCDMWGEWIDQTYNHNNDQYAYNDDDDSEAAKWYLFEDDIYGAFRNMKNPHQFGHPEKLYEAGYWYNGDPSSDEFTHQNNGVCNKLCYLLTDGDYFNGYTISGMGIPKTADLFYECQTNLLPSNAFYYDLGNVLILAAYNVGLTEDERNNVKNACAAVEILPQECFPVCHSKYNEWVLMGKPSCWCGNGRQCHGDADGLYQGSPTKGGIYYVGTNDLNVLMTAWQVKEPPWGPGIASVQWNGIGGICADFFHDAQGSATKGGLMRVSTNDLNILLANWMVREPPFGLGVPADCLNCGRGQQAQAKQFSFDEIMKWVEKVQLSPDIKNELDEEAWLKFVESLKKYK